MSLLFSAGLLFDEFLGEDPAEGRALAEWAERTGIPIALLAMFGREPAGRGDMTDRRALLQVIGDAQLAKAPQLMPARIRRKLTSRL